MTCHGGSIIALPLLAGLAGAATTFVVFVCSAAAPKATVSAAAPPGLPAKRFPKPPRPVAGIVSDQRSNEDSREGTGEAAKVMDLLGILPGMTVADIGAGTGNYIARLSHRVGPGGRVVAQDVKLSPLIRLGHRVSRERLGNVSLAVVEPHDPRLPKRSVDLALFVYMYHGIALAFGLLVNLIRQCDLAGRWRSWTWMVLAWRMVHPAHCCPVSSRQ